MTCFGRRIECYNEAGFHENGLLKELKETPLPVSGKNSIQAGLEYIFDGAIVDENMK